MLVRASLVALSAVVVLAGCGAESELEDREGPGGTGGVGGSGGTGGEGGTGGTGGDGGTGGTGGDGGSGGTGGSGGSEAHCGNGIREGDEQCDDGEGVNSDTRPDACRTDCTLARCGDGVIDSGETCDDGNTQSGDGCSSTCQLESTCGDGVAEYLEPCDGDDLRGATCGDHGYNTGTLACSQNCTLDFTGCALVEFCGNGIDDTGNGLVDCEDPGCADDPIACPRCGDGMINQAEEACDGDDVSLTCELLGFTSGVVGCTDTCEIVTAGCVPAEVCSSDEDEDGDGLVSCDDPDCYGHWECPQCGDGILQRDEVCDGGPPPGMSCSDFGFNSGRLGCDPFTCQPTTDDCYTTEICDNGIDDLGNGLIDCADPACSQVPPCPVCGNGVLEEGEECDDGNGADGDGCSSTCQIQPFLLVPAEGTIVMTGQTNASSPTYRRPSGNCGVNTGGTGYRYHLQYVQNPFPYPARVRFTASWPLDGYLHVTRLPFDPQAPLDNCAGSNDDFNSTAFSRVDNILLAPGETVGVIATTFSEGNSLSSYTIDVLTLSMCGDGVVTGNEYCDPNDPTDPEAASCTATCDPPGETCEDPLPVADRHFNPATQTWVIDSTTSIFSSAYTPSCYQWSAGAPDNAIEFTAPEAGGYGFTIIDDFAAVWSIFDGTCSAENELFCGLFQPTTGLHLAAGQTVYVVVDGLDSAFHGPYRLEIRRAFCGNGVVEAGEQCDDGNNTSGDGCSATCENETVAIPAPGSSRTLTGALPVGSPTYTRPDSGCVPWWGGSGAFYYSDRQLVNQTGATAVVTITGNWPVDGFLHVSREPFNPANPVANCAATNDDWISTSQSQVQVTMAPGETVRVIATTYSEGITMSSYTLDVQTAP